MDRLPTFYKWHFFAFWKDYVLVERVAPKELGKEGADTQSS